MTRKDFKNIDVFSGIEKADGAKWQKDNDIQYVWKTPEQIQALKSKLAQMDEADVDQEADESVFEDEDIVTDTSADGKSASGGESQTADIKIEAEDDKEESVN